MSNWRQEREHTRRSNIDAATSNPQHHRIITLALDEDRGKASWFAYQLQKMSPPSVDLLEYFLESHLLQLRHDSKKSLTVTFQSTPFALLGVWVSDLDNHFETLHAVFGNKYSHHSFDIVSSLTYYRENFPNVLTTIEQETALLRVLSWSANTPDIELHHKVKIDGAIILRDPDLFLLVANHPEHVDELIRIIERDGYDRAAPLELHLSVSPNSPLNIGAL